jgi:hypothetical protein
MAAEAEAAQLVFMAELGCIGFAPPLQEEIVAYTGCTNIAMLDLMTPDNFAHVLQTFEIDSYPRRVTIGNTLLG